ncbi:DUF3658 domain-containing protein [Saccharibacillus sp. CPCC 101409]|uniref:DUF1835 domain-containing protein n=1 Tax=Saccharibacillus sp. CPCC 101409 TaxID=3058041 RepID=UPI002672F314|nr:DUF1835 domain-containing protein [Saccharibacillus sp. CPCC 101409]MDO3410072.1 DUF3658 domain-containing protein [Saccharibacillus sp. CPCC 101409]
MGNGEGARKTKLEEPDRKRRLLEMTAGMNEDQLRAVLDKLLGGEEALQAETGNGFGPEAFGAEKIENEASGVGVGDWNTFRRTLLEREPGLSAADALERVHIVPSDSAAAGLRQALQPEIESGRERVYALGDNLSYGPIRGLDSREGGGNEENGQYEESGKHEGGWIDRLGWLEETAGLGDAERRRGLDGDYRLLAELPERLSADTEIVIWAAGTAADQTALRLVLFLFRHFAGTVRIVDALDVYGRLQSLGRIGRKGITVTHLHSGEMMPDDLRAVWQAASGMTWEKAARLKEPGMLRDGKAVEAEDEGLISIALPGEERRRLEREWTALSVDGATLRTYRDGSVVAVPEDYYDGYLLETAAEVCGPGGEYRKAARVVGQAIGYSEEHLSDGFLNHRLNMLVYSGKLEFRGVPRLMRMYEVRPVR